MRSLSLLALGLFGCAGIPESPSLDSARITPDVLYAGDLPSCEGQGWYSPDGMGDRSIVGWYINGATASGYDTLFAENTVRGGDVVTCTVTPFDGETFGEPVETSVTVSNSPPTLIGVQMQPMGPISAGTMLWCQTYGYSDPDFDMEQTDIAWFRDGVPANSGAQFAGLTEEGHTYRCVAVATDGMDDGNVVFAEVAL